MASNEWVAVSSHPRARTDPPRTMIVNENVVERLDLSSVAAMTLFFKANGSTFSISASQAAFANRLLLSVPVTAPGVKPALVVTTGAADLRKVFSAHDPSSILAAYLDGPKVAFTIAVDAA